MSMASTRIRARFAALLTLGGVVACQHGAADEGVTAPASAPAPAACPAAWVEPPVVDPALAVPAANAHVVLHASATGTQNYACKPTLGDAGAGYAWALVGPEAALNDCRAAPLGRHFPTGTGAPEWQMTDGSYVSAHKVAARAPDGASVPWLLLEVEGHGGSAPFTAARYVQRVRTSGGVMPAGGCDEGHVGTLQKVPYTADYYFFAL